eukprot:g79807.t1
MRSSFHLFTAVSDAKSKQAVRYLRWGERLQEATKRQSPNVCQRRRSLTADPPRRADHIIVQGTDLSQFCTQPSVGRPARLPLKLAEYGKALYIPLVDLSC